MIEPQLRFYQWRIGNRLAVNKSVIPHELNHLRTRNQMRPCKICGSAISNRNDLCERCTDSNCDLAESNTSTKKQSFGGNQEHIKAQVVEYVVGGLLPGIVIGAICSIVAFAIFSISIQYSLMIGLASGLIASAFMPLINLIFELLH